jgi:hypothetical protein
MRSVAADVPKGARNTDGWPVYQTLRRDHSRSCGGNSAGVVADMVSVLLDKNHGSTAEALAFLRQLYPRYPLTLRLAAIVAHSKMPQYGVERPVAQ